jgi:hypothetical protein
MLRTLTLALLAPCLAVPGAAFAEPTTQGTASPTPDTGLTSRVSSAEGRIQSEAGRVEILGRPVRVGEKLELPEGFIRVEEEGIEDRQVGSFTVVPAETLRPTSIALAGATGRPPAQAGPEPAGPETAPAQTELVEAATSAACRRERSEYLRELWKESGIDVKDPVAVIEGLEAGAQGPATAYYWFALATDPFRPLAWSSDLRSRADALARCVRRD